MTTSGSVYHSGRKWPRGFTNDTTGGGQLPVIPITHMTPSLFPEDHDRLTVSNTMDAINRQFGKNVIRVGTLCGSEDTAPTRIAFTVVPEFDPASI
jgi:DNA polymerase IV